MQQFPGGGEPPEAPEDAAARRPLLRRSMLPPMTLAIAAAVLLMGIVQFAAGGYRWQSGQLAGEAVNWALGAKVPTLIAHGEYWRLVTASFLHGSWMHLGLNLLGLWVVGRLVEAFYGPARVLVIFTLSALLGVVFSYTFTLSTSLGASTGVMGLVGAVIWHNWKYRQYLPPRLIYVYRLLLMLVVIQFVLDLRSETVDAFGHLGGFFGGVLVAMLLESRIAGASQGENEWLPLGTALATVAVVLGYGAAGLALSLPGSLDLLRAGAARTDVEQTAYINQVVARRPYFTEARLHLMLLLLSQGREAEAQRAYTAALAANPSFRATPYLATIEKRIVERIEVAATLLDRAGHPEAALERYERLMTWGLGPFATAAGQNGYAWILVDRLERDFNEAHRYAILATNKFPDEPAFQDTLAWIYFKTERLDEALSTQLRAMEQAAKVPKPLQSDSAMAEMHYHLAAIYARLGRNVEARENYTEALARKSDFAPAVEGLRRLDDLDDDPRQRGGPTRAARPVQRTLTGPGALRIT
ncbi:MAG: rhomboid family intramembrane serine protease [Actinomycetota bacterium]